MVRTFNEIITVALAEYHHWQFLCDLVDNDYDISYFGGRVTEANEFVEFLRSNDFKNLQEITDYLQNQLNDANYYVRCYEDNENYKGAQEELEFLLKYCIKDYC